VIVSLGDGLGKNGRDCEEGAMFGKPPRSELSVCCVGRNANLRLEMTLILMTSLAQFLRITILPNVLIPPETAYLHVSRHSMLVRLVESLDLQLVI